MSNYEISKSSLLSLKAEILRKQEEVKNRASQNVRKNVPLVIKNKDVEKRNEKDTIEELDLLEKSRIALERKTKLYDRLSASTVYDEDPASAENRFLVRFKDKEKNEPSVDEEDYDLQHNYYDDDCNSDEEWVEYVDCLGRTRTCLKKDLQYFKSKDQDYKRDEPQEETIVNEENTEVNTIPNEDSEQRQLLSDDMRREMLRQQWEREESELSNKNDIHYQDILFNEARSHGVGYYGFSKDEHERRQQQASLEKLRAETQQEQKKSQDLKAVREQQLAARIKAARMRKRARLGLPVEEEEEDAEIGPAIPQASTEPLTNDEDNWKEQLLEEARRNHIRPWDIGKEKVGELYVYSQEEWIEKQRKERVREFAPPLVNRRDFRALPAEVEVSNTKRYLTFSTIKNSLKKIENNLTGHINPYKHTSEDLQDPYNEETRTFSSYKVPKTIATNKRKIDEVETDTNIEVKFSEVSDDRISFDDRAHNRIPCEEVSGLIPPNSNVQEEKCPDSSTVPQNIEASIEAGLKYLRKQAEKKASMRDYENGDMFAM